MFKKSEKENIRRMKEERSKWLVIKKHGFKKYYVNTETGDRQRDKPEAVLLSEVDRNVRLLDKNIKQEDIPPELKVFAHLQDHRGIVRLHKWWVTDNYRYTYDLWILQECFDKSLKEYLDEFRQSEHYKPGDRVEVKYKKKWYPATFRNPDDFCGDGDVKSTQAVVTYDDTPGKCLRVPSTDIRSPPSNTASETSAFVQLTSILLKSAEDLEAMHGDGILHKDIKTANFCVNENDGRSSIIDFGCSDFFNPASCKCKDYPFKTEVYHFGTVCLEALEAARAIQVEPQHKIKYGLRSQSPKAIVAVRARVQKLDDEWKALLMDMLTPPANYKDRPSMDEVVTRIRQLL